MRLGLTFCVTAATALSALAACSNPSNKKDSSSAANTAGSANAGGTSAAGQACFAVVDGTDIPFTDYPAVAHILTSKTDGTSAGLCSGTFISPRAMLTAGHCIHPSGNVVRVITKDAKVPMDGSASAAYLKAVTFGAKATKVIDIGFTQDSAANGSDNINDLAVVIFDSDVAPAVLPIATKRPSAGSSLTLVGFGRDALPDEAQAYTSIKRSGITRLLETAPKPTLLYTGLTTRAASTAAAGKASLASEGDSGGAMIFDNQIVATLISGASLKSNNGGPTVYFNLSVDLTSPQALKLIDLANKAGAQIPPPGTAKSKDQVATTAVVANQACPR